MSKAGKEEAKPPMLLGRPSNNVSIGIVGMPNIGKCFAAGTELFTARGSVIAVEAVADGDLLMGDDNTARTVQPGSLTRGTAAMYRISPAKHAACLAAPVTVNGDHILVLQHRPTPRRVAGEWRVRDVERQRWQQSFAEEEEAWRWCRKLQERQQLLELSVDYYLQLPAADREELHCVMAAAVEFLSSTPSALSSLLLSSPAQPQRYSSVLQLARDMGLCMAGREADSVPASPLLRSALLSLRMRGDAEQQLQASPWLQESVDTRRAFLSGLIDGSDARLSSDAQAYELTFPTRAVLDAVSTIALSLGLRPHSAHSPLLGPHQLCIAGDFSPITLSPVRPSAWCSGLHSFPFVVEPVGESAYYGFAVDGNHRLLLSSFVVTHNSSLFNVLSNLNVPAENYPFCTIDPSTARVPVPDERFDFLVSTFKPASRVPAVLTITDIAGLVKGANEGKGLGNAFLSHIQAVDAIYHLVRAFKDTEIEHVEGSVDPVRDLGIISEELQLKDYSRVHDRLEVVKRLVEKGQDKGKKHGQDVATLTVADQLLADKKDVRSHRWKPEDVDVLNELQLLTAKPVVYLVNIGEDEYYAQKNRFLPKVKDWVSQRDPQARVIPFSVAYESKLTALPDDAARKAMQDEKKVPSQLPKIITTGYHALDLVHFFTAGEDEVRGWTIKRGTLAPAAAGVIHTDFQKAFIAAEVMAFDDFKDAGSEAAVKAAGKYRTKGKDYTVADGDILFFKHNAGGAKKK